MDDSSDSRSMDDGALSELLGSITSDAEATLSGGEPSTTDTDQVSTGATEPLTSTVPSGDAAAGAVTAPAQEPVSPATTESTSPKWDSDENPFFKQAQESTAFIQALRQTAASNAQRAEQQREYAAIEALERELPNLDPDKQQLVFRSIIAYKDQQAAQALSQLERQYEPIAQQYAIGQIGERLSLTKEERAELARFQDPNVMEWAATKTSTLRKQAEARETDLRNQLQEISLKVAANERRGSAVDRVPGAGGTAGATDNAESLDDLVAGLDLSAWSR